MAKSTLTPMLLLLLLPLLLSTPLASALSAPCTPQESCWPTAAEVSALAAALDPSANRTLAWAGPGTPRPCAVPIESPNEQPLYGIGVDGLKPVYSNTAQPGDPACFKNGYVTPYCCVTTRNSPDEGWQPAFTVWPLSSAHVQAAVAFATRHRLPICVAGTGHDFLNRHSCNQGLLVRTALLKEQTYVGANAIRLGSGLTFSEIEHTVAAKQQFVATGWATTVGIAGWSLGGGHGPFGAAVGLGTDNILEAQLVVANGSLVTATATATRIEEYGTGRVTVLDSSDLHWALRGGGGSTWGILTSLTIRTHDAPAGGFTVAKALWAFSLCDTVAMDAAVDSFLAWAQNRSSKYFIQFFCKQPVD